MQFKTSWNKDISFGPIKTWKDEINATGATQMQFAKKLMTSRTMFNRSSAQDLVVNQGERYNYLPALQVKGAIYVYTYTGKNIELNLARYAGKKVKSAWYNPRNGEYIAIESFTAKGVKFFDAPGEEKEGNDWVLVITNL